MKDTILNQTSLAEVRDTFQFLDDWEDRYRYVIDLGKKLPDLDDAEKIDLYKVRGCQSQVWLVPEKKDGRLSLRGDSDAHIVRGLVALMLLIFSDKTPADILKTDARAILDELGLAQHLSPMRANGLFSMVERIRAIAADAL
ncbi:SufE family protein [Eilatimonas milleporae]|uniref:Cysteine desulfuration protein SufE n=1 Tax=Eilatimonas milleporae TaxID=911205 RepID=A0A3M0C1R0_9PROT|nr:SufE family protein [Eilatimonas milleporae]RMB02805.1 cysteine desulfuration protein SufE [Eilatimonas milleporae]